VNVGLDYISWNERLIYPCITLARYTLVRKPVRDLTVTQVTVGSNPTEGARLSKLFPYSSTGRARSC
jgi:hypothetical protein